MFLNLLFNMKQINIIATLLLLGFLALVCSQSSNEPLAFYEVFKLEGCLLSEVSFLTLVLMSVSQCADECFLKPQCNAIEYEQRLKVCELLENDRDETVPRSWQKHPDCVYLRKSVMTARNQIPSVCNGCVSGETCDLELLQCVRKDVSTLTNVALGKPTSMSSVFRDYVSGRGVDGDITQSLMPGFCFHTENEHRPWWQVDLQAVYNIHIVRLYNRMDCCGERALNVMLFLGKTLENNVAIQYKEGPIGDVYDFKLAGIEARYVNLTLNATSAFHLCEVQVMGLPSVPTIGKTCSNDSECLETASQCISSRSGAAGKCFCNRLYRYNSTSRDCERVCRAIQNDFIKYDKAIAAYSSIASNIKLSLVECRDKCISNTECMSFEWSLSGCNMGIVSLEMIIDTDPLAFRPVSGWNLYSRVCQ